MIRRAQEKDVPKIGDLLRQVCLVHHHGRPDIFKAGRKYTDEQLQVLLQDAARPILVAVDDSGISVSSVAIFQNGYMKSTLEDLMCYKLLCGKGGNFSYDADPEGTLFLNQRAKPVVKIFADEKLTIDIYVAIDSSIAVLKADNKEALRYVAAEQIRKRLINTLVESRDKGSDVFGFFKYGRSSFLTEEAWDAYNWRERYKTAQFNVTVEILPEKTGLLKGAA